MVLEDDTKLLPLHACACTHMHIKKITKINDTVEVAHVSLLRKWVKVTFLPIFST